MKKPIFFFFYCNTDWRCGIFKAGSVPKSVHKQLWQEKWEVNALKKQSIGVGERGQSSRHILCYIDIKDFVLRNHFLIILSLQICRNEGNKDQVVNYRPLKEMVKNMNLFCCKLANTVLRATTTNGVHERKETCTTTM